MQAACRRLLFYDRAPLEMKHLDHNSGFDWGQRDTNHTEAFTNEVPAENSEIISLIFGLSSQSSVMFPLFAVAHKSCFSLSVQPPSLDKTLYEVRETCQGLKMSFVRSKKSAFTLPKNHKHMPHSMTAPPSPLSLLSPHNPLIFSRGMLTHWSRVLAAGPQLLITALLFTAQESLRVITR